VCQLQCERTREKISFEPLSENSKSRSWRNDVWQTVPEAAIVSEMTYTVSSGTLNPSIPYHTGDCKQQHLQCL